MNHAVYPQLDDFFRELQERKPATMISAERLQRLNRYESEFEGIRRGEGNPVGLLFVCTHNSRRSQLSEFWARALVSWLGKADQIMVRSGGTEVTRVAPLTLETLRVAGFKTGEPITDWEESGSDNSKVPVSWGEGQEASAWSKTFQGLYPADIPFTAIMTCKEADEACPFVPGAAARVSLPYSDPKQYDGHPEGLAQYQLVSGMIVSELAYLLGI